MTNKEREELFKEIEKGRVKGLAGAIIKLMMSTQRYSDIEAAKIIAGDAKEYEWYELMAIVKRLDPFVVYNKKNRDEYFIVRATDKEQVLEAVINDLDNDTYWVTYSIKDLLQNHKEICIFNDQECEFYTVGDIINNERAFQEILDQMDRYPTIKSVMNENSGTIEEKGGIKQ